MDHWLFYLFAALMLVFGLGVILNQNPVASALCLVVSFIGLAALFVQLDAYFVGVIQILVYAGAVMVLFLFIIMLLDIKAEEKRKLNYLAFAGGIILVLVFVVQLGAVLSGFKEGQVKPPPIQTAAVAKIVGAQVAEADKLPDVHLVGHTIFREFNFPLQIVGVLLLVSTIGVVALSKRRLS